MAEVFNLGNGNNARITGKVLASYQDDNGNFEGVEVDNLRASPAYEQNENGLLQEVDNDVLRIDYSDNANGEILTEGDAEQFLEAAEDLTAVIWAKQGAGTGSVPIVTPNVTSSPIEGVMADMVSFDLNGGISNADLSIINQSFNAKNGKASFFIKANTNVRINARASTTWQAIDVTTKWQRLDLIAENGGSVQIGLRGGVVSGSADLADVYLVGVNVTEDNISSYIPYKGTRAADTGITTGDISHLINSEEGVLEVDFTIYDLNNDKRFSLGDGTATGNNVTFKIKTDGRFNFFIFAQGVQVINTEKVFDFVLGQRYSVKIKYKSGNSGVKIDDVEEFSSTTSFDIIGMDKLKYSRSDGGADDFTGKIHETIIYNDISNY